MLRQLLYVNIQYTYRFFPFNMQTHTQLRTQDFLNDPPDVQLTIKENNMIDSNKTQLLIHEKIIETIECLKVLLQFKQHNEKRRRINKLRHIEITIPAHSSVDSFELVFWC